MVAAAVLVVVMVQRWYTNFFNKCLLNYIKKYYCNTSSMSLDISS